MLFDESYPHNYPSLPRSSMKVHKNKNLIILFGPDGAGKTTLAKILAKNLAKKGIRVKISWMRGTHTLALIIAYFLSRFNSLKGEDNPYFHIRSPSPVKFWQFIEFISAIPVILFKYEAPGLIGYTVIGDRGCVDFIVWVMLTTNDPSFIRTIFSRFLLKLASRSVNIYVTASIETLLARRKSDEKFLLKQKIIYSALCKYLNAYIVVTEKRNDISWLYQELNI